MLKIYGRTTSSNVQKVLWCCGEIGLDFERIDIDAAFGGLKTPAYLALNPNGLMPTIDDDGFILWESNVAVRYLAAKHSHGKLCPADLRARADCERWMDWQQTALAAPMGVAFRALLREPREAMPDEQLQAAVKRAGELWRMLDARLAERAYVGGDALTMGDVALGNAIHRWYKLPVQRPELPRLRQWYDRLCERPAYRQHVASV
jgi:glutathione S-transferase